MTWPGPNLTPAETWTLGHRNPYGLAFAPDGRLWETEMGPRGGDELNLIERGKNYGWPVVSEGMNYDRVPIPPHATHPEFAPPKLSWVPVDLADEPAHLHRQICSRSGRAAASSATLTGNGLIRVTLQRRPRREGRAMGHAAQAHPLRRAGTAKARSICSRTVTAGACSG